MAGNASTMSQYTLRDISAYLGYTRECDALGLEPAPIEEFFDGPR